MEGEEGVLLLVVVEVGVLPFLEEAEVEEGPLLLFQGVEVEGEVHPYQEEGVAVEVLHPLQGVVEEEGVHPCQEVVVEVEVPHSLQGVEEEGVDLIQELAPACFPAADGCCGKVKLFLITK